MNNVGKDPYLLANIVLNGGVVAFPTETVMGLGVVYDNKEAYERLNQIKGRPEDKPYTMMLSDVSEIEKYAVLEEKYLGIVKKFMPGPLTILLKAKDNVPGWVTHNTGIIGIRVPDYKILQDVLKIIKKPLLVPSANPSGQTPAKNVSQVIVYFNNSLDYIYDYNAEGRTPSTIVDLTRQSIKIIREGEIPLNELLEQN